MSFIPFQRGHFHHIYPTMVETRRSQNLDACQALPFSPIFKPNKTCMPDSCTLSFEAYKKSGLNHWQIQRADSSPRDMPAGSAHAHFNACSMHALLSFCSLPLFLHTQVFVLPALSSLLHSLYCLPLVLLVNSCT